MGYKEYTVGVFDNGDKAWYLNDKRHREDGPAIEFSDGGKEWWIDGKRHRKDGPAVEFPNDSREWWTNGELHREDGPAIEFANGTKKWFIEGIEYTEKEFLNRKQVNSCDGKIVEIDGVKYKLKIVE